MQQLGGLKASRKQLHPVLVQVLTSCADQPPLTSLSAASAAAVATALARRGGSAAQALAHVPVIVVCPPGPDRVEDPQQSGADANRRAGHDYGVLQRWSQRVSAVWTGSVIDHGHTQIARELSALVEGVTSAAVFEHAASLDTDAAREVALQVGNDFSRVVLGGRWPNGLTLVEQTEVRGIPFLFLCVATFFVVVVLHCVSFLANSVCLFVSPVSLIVSSVFSCLAVHVISQSCLCVCLCSPPSRSVSCVGTTCWSSPPTSLLRVRAASVLLSAVV